MISRPGFPIKMVKVFSRTGFLCRCVPISKVWIGPKVSRSPEEMRSSCPPGLSKELIFHFFPKFECFHMRFQIFQDQSCCSFFFECNEIRVDLMILLTGKFLQTTTQTCLKIDSWVSIGSEERALYDVGVKISSNGTSRSKDERLDCDIEKNFFSHQIYHALKSC